MLTIKEVPQTGFEKLLEGIDEEAGLHCFIALHNLTLGPSLGGVRMYPYQNNQEARVDVLRLAKGMTYKSALAQVGLGGGKSVIIGDPKKDKNEGLLHSFAEVVNRLRGQYIAAEDIGTSPEDMSILKKTTPYVSALPTPESSGDPSPFTARGVIRGMEAVTERLWGTRDLSGRTIAIQGLGSVGAKVAATLFWRGAELILADLFPDKAEELSRKYGARSIPCDKIYEVDCDIFCPCAMGGVLSPKTIPLLKCKAIAGSANNQLLNDGDGRLLMDKGILYAPDFVINAGGLINAAAEFEEGGYDPKVARNKVNRIYHTLRQVFARQDTERRPTSEIANEIAENNIRLGVGKRKMEITFSPCFTCQ